MHGVYQVLSIKWIMVCNNCVQIRSKVNKYVINFLMAWMHITVAKEGAGKPS